MTVTRFRVFRTSGSRTRRLGVPKALPLRILAAILVWGSLSAFPESADKAWEDRVLGDLPLREKIAQLVQVRVPGKFLNRESADFRQLQSEIRQNRVGGVVLFAGNIYESALLLNELQTLSRLPLLVSADFERGAAFRIADTTSFPWAMALGAAGSEALAYEQGRITAQEARALGVHWIFAPVVDVNNNPDNPVIGIRSFGEDPELVARLGAAFIRGAKSGGALTTAKHFPGHGDTDTDSHIGLALVPSDLDRLRSVEWTPFRSAIAAGVDSIMTAHVAVPRVIGEPRLPATLSPKMLKDLLRGSLGFRGLLVTDALEMGAIANRYWAGAAAVRAIQAGADVVLLPADAAAAIREVELAVRRGDIPASRIEESARRILRAKRRLGLHQRRTVPVNRLASVVASPENERCARDIAERSVTVLKNEGSVLPLNPAEYPKIFSLVMTPDLESSPGAVFQAEMRRRFPLMRSAWLNARVSEEALAAAETEAAASDVLVCATTVRLVSGSAAAALPDSHRKLLETLLRMGKPLVWVAIGNPYVFPVAPQAAAYVCTFSTAEASQAAAAQAVAGEIPIGGRTPVSVSRYFKVGDGIQIPRLDMTLGMQPAAEEGESPGLREAARLLDAYVADGTFAGASLIVGRRNRVLLSHASGCTGPDPGSPRTSSDAAYPLGSLSGPMGAGSAAMLCVDSRGLLPDAPLEDYLPEKRTTAAGRLRIQDLLRFPGDEEMRAGNGGPQAADLLAEIVARATGTPTGRFLSERLFSPLGLAHTSVAPPEEVRGRAAAANPAHPALLSSARDLAVFAQMLLNRGVYDHRRYFKPETVDRFTGPRGSWSRQFLPDRAGGGFSPAAFGHRSDSGPLLWIDPERKLFVVLLANAARSGTPVPEAQKTVCESVLAALRE